MWKELGISKTADAGAIRKAYAQRLRAIGADKNIAAFQRLRAAYENALAYAERAPPSPPSTDPDGNSPHDETSLEIEPGAFFPAEPGHPEASSQATISGMPLRLDGAEGTFRPEPAWQWSSAALEQGDVTGALDDYDHAVAQGLLPLGRHEAVLDDIMRVAMRDESLRPEAFLALLKRVGWNGVVGARDRLSSVRKMALLRAEAENWYLSLRRAMYSKALFRKKGLKGVFACRADRRNARMLLQEHGWWAYRISPVISADLREKMAEYRHYAQWVGHRFSPACIDRAERRLNFSARWGDPKKLQAYRILIGIGIVAFCLSVHFYGTLVLWVFVYCSRWILLFL